MEENEKKLSISNPPVGGQFSINNQFPISKQNENLKLKIENSHHKVGRNDPCPCGSGKKYKKCHGK